MFKRIKKRHFIFTIFLFLVYFLTHSEVEIDLLWIISPSVTSESIQLLCYNNISINKLPSILNDIVPKNTSIFFVETSCHEKYLRLSARQACAIESAALMNPTSFVYLLIPSPIEEPVKLNLHTKHLFNYGNIKFRHVDMAKFFLNTPLEKFYAEGKLKSSRWPFSHASDLLRYTILWKYGGTYVDLDVIFLKPLAGFTNFAGAESLTDVAAGVLSLSHEFPLSYIAITELRDHFKGYRWGYNGPGVITRSLKTFCDTKEVSKMNVQNCHGFTVLPPNAIYPIHYKKWREYFTKNKEESDRIMTKFNESLAVHVWNKFSINEQINIGSGQPYDRLASKFCPKVYTALAISNNSF